MLSFFYIILTLFPATSFGGPLGRAAMNAMKKMMYKGDTAPPPAPTAGGVWEEMDSRINRVKELSAHNYLVSPATFPPLLKNLEESNVVGSPGLSAYSTQAPKMKELDYLMLFSEPRTLLKLFAFYDRVGDRKEGHARVKDAIRIMRIAGELPSVGLSVAEQALDLASEILRLEEIE